MVNTLANIVLAKVKTANNHAATITPFIALVVELTATNKRWTSQLAEVLGR